MSDTFRIGEPFIDVPVDTMVEDLDTERVMAWVERHAKAALSAVVGPTEVELVSTGVECFAERALGQHQLEECRFPGSIWLKHYVFQAKRVQL